MLYQVCAVHDSALNAYIAPFIANTINQATRMFSDEMHNANGQMCKHPTDYNLYHIGTWDNETAQFVPQLPRLITRGLDCFEPVPAKD